MPNEKVTMANKPLHELLSRDMVDIYVGSENTRWILHEKLICAKSAYFRNAFYKESSRSNGTKSYGLPDDEDEPFKAFVGWLYSGFVMPPHQESDLGLLFELYLMGERWEIPSLREDTISAVRNWYADHDTYPGLRRVQYVYANTEEGSEMRGMLVQSIARMLALSKAIPEHWDKALRKNGQLAVDIIRAVQEWHLEGKGVPDARSVVGDLSSTEGSDSGAIGEVDGRSADGFMSDSTESASAAATPVKNQSKGSSQSLLKELPVGLTKSSSHAATNGRH